MLKYWSHFNITLSDHRPVSALLQVFVSSVLPEKRSEVQADLVKQSPSHRGSSWSSLLSYVPSVDSPSASEVLDIRISPSPIIEFEVVRYDEPQAQFITLHNDSKVCMHRLLLLRALLKARSQAVAEWSFTLQLGRQELCPSWLHVSPRSGLILPGERITITFTVLVDKCSAGPLNFATDLGKDFSELLILSFAKRDFFLSVGAKTYERTYFGNSLQALARLGARPIRAATAEELSQAASVAEDEREASAVLQPIRRIVERLADLAADTDDLLASPPDPSLVRSLREALDTVRWL